MKKLKIYSLSLFDKLSQENVFGDILERKKAFLDYKKKEFKKLKNWDFAKGVSLCIRSNKLKIFYLFVLDIIGHENVCHDILERKKVHFFLSRISSNSFSLAYLAKNKKMENFQFF